ncbi:YopX family protein [Campylobacter jejuni]
MKLSDFDFRIWDGKKYINNIKGGVYIHKINDHIKCLNRSQDCYDYEFELDDLDNSNLEIELFTGLYDKNGNKIYENDILMNELTEEIFYITRDDTYKMSEIILYGKDYNGNLYRKRNPGGINLLKMFVSDKNMSVVGNIHENPELLEEGKQWKLANL